ncbi:MAG: tRNA (cytidine(34)-2'-O)-methyltransferase [Phycisphaerales bacterium JB040]
MSTDHAQSQGTRPHTGGLGVRVVLHEPEIPNNTGTIGRACVAMGCPLDLIEPLGFSLDEKALRRAGLDYWPRLAPAVHPSWEVFRRKFRADQPEGGVWLLTTRASRPVYDADIRPGDAIVLGKETAGLPDEVLRAHPDRCVCLPMLPGERSLNLACAAVAVMSEAARQCLARGDRTLDDRGRLTIRG